jgi:hypothetical protein
MRTILIFCTLATLLFTGCAVPRGGKPFIPPFEFTADGRNAYTAAVGASYTLDIRTNVLNARAPMIQGIKEACAKGVQVSVILYVGGRNSAAVLAGTCAEIYLSDYPELQYGDVALLLDGNYLVVNGRAIASRNQLSQDEYFFMLRQKLTSRRIQ